MKLFLGVDGGQSSTTALVGDETGRVMGVGRAGPCNHAGAAEVASDSRRRSAGRCAPRAETLCLNLRASDSAGVQRIKRR